MKIDAVCQIFIYGISSPSDIAVMKPSENKLVTLTPAESAQKKQSLLQRLYESRRQHLPTMGLRSKPSMAVAITLAMTLLSILLSLSWVQKSEIDYLRSSSVVKIIDDLEFKVRKPNQEPIRSKFLDLAQISVTELNGAAYEIYAEISTQTIASVEQSTPDEAIILAMPAFLFKEAFLETSWAGSRKFIAGEYLSLGFKPQKIETTESTQWIKLTITPQNNQKFVLSSPVNQTPVFLSGQIRFQKFQDFVAGKRTGSGKQLADIGRIVLALFSVLLFVFIDSSAECLGLGIFMSLKALGVVAAQRWYPDSLLPAWLIGVLPSFLLGFADFMQLYFFTQLARLFKPKAMHWLGVGFVFGIVYAWGATIQTVPGGINWSKEVWRYRNLLIGFGCLACSIPVMIACFRDKHYHRAAALLIASSGVLSQVITPMIVDIPGVTDALWYKTWYNLIETHTPYMFALSTFINVSTLEKRVKALSETAIQAKLMEQEMALGKTVQEAFFRAPPMPQGIGLAISHRAEMYVSGDLIYSYHDQDHQTATALLCDVTGHGVQAALKASICSVICDSIWDVNKLRKGDKPYQRLEILKKRATGFFAKTYQKEELLAIVGCEIMIEEKKAYFYRANAVFPIVIAKNENNLWQSKVLSIPSETIFPYQLLGHSYIVMFSDGLIDSSKTYKRFSDWLNFQLKNIAPGRQFQAEDIKQLILEFKGWQDTRDDQTMCVLEVA